MKLPLGTIKNRAAFAEHAAPEAVAVHLKAAEIRAARANAEVRWLAELLEKKTQAAVPDVLAVKP